MICYLGQNTMTVFLIHKPIVWLLEDALDGLDIVNEVKLVLTVCITVIVSCLVSNIINFFIPAAVGKNRIDSETYQGQANDKNYLKK